jgi:putative tricarboxylic transport membrane protein
VAGVPELMAGFAAIFTLGNLMWLLIGVSVGMIVGIFPGLGPTAGIAILLPLTIGMDPTSAIIMLAAIYYGSMYGATVTAIMINTPGAAAVVASTFDGYPMAQQGRAGPALVMQAVASFVGGTVGVILLTVLTPSFARLARSFGPAEFLLVVTMGLLTLVLLVGDDKLKGVISALLGFAIATVGVDLGTGASRFTFGSPELISGINFVPIAIGLFGLGELLHVMYTGIHRKGYAVIDAETKVSMWPTRDDWKYSRWTFGSGSIIGFVLGVIPGAGATVASLVAYSFERAVSKIKHQFGKGAMPGLVAPESANNASSSGAMIPLLTLGLPGSASTAVLLGAFILWGLRPGPLLMVQESEFAWGLIASMYLGNMMLVVLCIVAIPVFVSILKVPYRILLPGIAVLCAVGAYSVNASRVELWLALVFGVVGFFMKIHGYSPAATVVALVLAPLAEDSLRQTIIISRGDPTWIWNRPIARWLLIALIVIALIKPVMRAMGVVLGKGKGGKLALPAEGGVPLPDEERDTAPVTPDASNPEGWGGRTGDDPPHGGPAEGER